MKIIAQSQPAAKVSYIHLAYLSAQLSNRISKAESFPMQALLGAAIALVIAGGVIGAKLGHSGRRGRAVQLGAVAGLLAALGGLWVAHAAWEKSRNQEAVVQHLIQTRQFWALREAPLAACIEAAALTNGTAAAMAADYYSLKSGGGEDTPEFVVKGYRYCELAAAQGQESHWVRLVELTNDWRAWDQFEAALRKGKLSQPEKLWTKQHLTQLTNAANEKR